MDLSTKYLGLDLPHPFVVGASPLTDDLDMARRLEDAGAAALVLRSLFEEQIGREQIAVFLQLDRRGESFAEALTCLPRADKFALQPDEYLEQLRRVTEAVHIPVIASLNGAAPGGWLDYPQTMERIGAAAIELNLHRLALDPDRTGEDVEREAVEVVQEIKRKVRIPVAVKLSPFYSSFAHFARWLDRAGADGLVLFNRFYQPDIDIEKLQVEESLRLSTAAELPLRLRWLAALSGRVQASLAVTGGVQNGLDAVKAVMAGADVVQVVSTLMRYGPESMRTLVREMQQWMKGHGWNSLVEMKGSMNLTQCPDPEAYERANYMLVLQSRR
jgi:dihydroorotate dehydrogenase (fumarate)